MQFETGDTLLSQPNQIALVNGEYYIYFMGFTVQKALINLYLHVMCSSANTCAIHIQLHP